MMCQVAEHRVGDHQIPRLLRYEVAADLEGPGLLKILFGGRRKSVAGGARRPVKTGQQIGPG
jgi:hypothetical protein